MEGKDKDVSSGDGLLSRMALNDNKAGMEGLDKDRINKIIIEASKGSKFYENELKKEQQVNQRIERMTQQVAQVTEQQLRNAEAQVEKLAAALENGRDLDRVIVHVDMDAFYAAVEMRDCPELKDKPMAVGSWSMLSTSNYHARKFGVRAAMPGFIAKKLCPNLVIVPLNFDKYRAVSSEVRDIFAEYDPNFVPMSLDEAYLDITDHLAERQSWPDSMRTQYLRSHNVAAGDEEVRESSDGPGSVEASPVLFEDSPSESAGPHATGAVVVFGTCADEAVREMRFKIEQKTSLTASAGIAPNTMLAKVCSDKNKPNGQYRIPAERQEVMDFIEHLPIRKVPGIGKVTEKMLSALGITTCAELRHKVALLSLLFSETSWHHFLQISLGLGSTHIERDGERKSMSTERTFAEMSSAQEQYALCQELCRDLAHDLRKEGLKGKTVTLKLKNVNFEVKTRALTLMSVVSTEDEIFAAARELLKTEVDHVSPHPLRLRLMGVRVSGFVSSEDKKPLQKSIIGFLQSGQSESGKATPSMGFEHRRSNDNLGKHPNLQHVGNQNVQQALCTDVTQEAWNGQVKQEVSTKEVEPLNKTQSFFQRAHAQRLRLQAVQEKLQDPGDSAHPESDAPRMQCFMCPVCFQKQEGTDLGSFNRHVDQCLIGASQEPRKTDTVIRPGEGHTGYDIGGCKGQWNGATKTNMCELQSVTEHRTVGPATEDGQLIIPSARPPAHSNRALKAESSAAAPLQSDRTSASTSCTSFKMATAGNGEQGVSGQESTSPVQAPVGVEQSGLTGSPFTCPVCNVRQDTSDLAIFNQHVDVCLNQGFLQELTQEACPGVKGKSGAITATSDQTGKNKRARSSPPPGVHKRTRAAGSMYTIDKFFR